MLFLLIYPNFDNLYVIDIYEKGYNGCQTIEEQHTKIKQKLTQGNNKGTEGCYVDGKYNINQDVIHYIKK